MVQVVVKLVEIAQQLEQLLEVGWELIELQLVEMKQLLEVGLELTELQLVEMKQLLEVG